MQPDADLIAFYSEGAFERNRLQRGRGRLEFARTQELLHGHLPPPPASVADVGGGPGTHAAWLARAGYVVQLLDVVPALVEQAAALSAGQPERPFGTAVGDARALPWDRASMDAVVLLGPLYHLPDARDRAQALAEAHRVLRGGGILVAAAISRYAALLDAMRAGNLDDALFARLSEGVLRSGRMAPGGFTSAFCHTPDGLNDEVEAAGFQVRALYGLEGPGWLLFDKPWGQREGADDEPDADPALLQSALRVARATESEPTLLGASSHLLAIASTPT